MDKAKEEEILRKLEGLKRPYPLAADLIEEVRTFIALNCQKGVEELRDRYGLPIERPPKYRAFPSDIGASVAGSIRDKFEEYPDVCGALADLESQLVSFHDLNYREWVRHWRHVRQLEEKERRQ